MSWFALWGSRGKKENPRHVMAIPGKLDYLRIYFQAWAYIAHRWNEESWRTFQQRVYAILRHLTRQGKEEPKMRIVTLKSEVVWSVVWKNLRRAILPAEIRSKWYVVTHVVLRTNDRLYRIRLSDTDKCRRCNAQDTPLHRLTDCGDSSDVWIWTQFRIALIQPIDHRRILHPNFTFWTR